MFFLFITNKKKNEVWSAFVLSPCVCTNTFYMNYSCKYLGLNLYQTGKSRNWFKNICIIFYISQDQSDYKESIFNIIHVL